MGSCPVGGSVLVGSGPSRNLFWWGVGPSGDLFWWGGGGGGMPPLKIINLLLRKFSNCRYYAATQLLRGSPRASGDFRGDRNMISRPFEVTQERGNDYKTNLLACLIKCSRSNGICDNRRTVQFGANLVFSAIVL